MIIIDKLVEKIVDKVFESVGSEFTEKINIQKELKAWANSFEKVAEYSDLISLGFGKELSSHRTMMRYFYATYDPTVSMPCIDDFILAIGMEFLDYQLKISPEVIIGYGNAVMKNWVMELYNNKFLRKKTEENDRDIQKMISIKDVNCLKNILSESNNIRVNFFKSFEHSDGFKTIRVWLPRPNENWIRWDKEYSVDIKVNPMIGMDLGFFRIGYDYSLISGEDSDNLKFAALSSSKTKETGEFKTFCIGEKAGEPFWGR